MEICFQHTNKNSFQHQPVIKSSHGALSALRGCNRKAAVILGPEGLKIIYFVLGWCVEASLHHPNTWQQGRLKPKGFTIPVREAAPAEQHSFQ